MHRTPAPTILSLFETRTPFVPPPEEIGIDIGPWYSACFFNIHHKTLLVIISEIMNSTDAFNPLTPMSDQDRTSPYNINTISSRQVMRIKKNISQGIVS